MTATEPIHKEANKNITTREIARLSEISGAKVEINLFHRTPERIAGLTKMMKKVGIDALGENADDKIPGLSSERAKCCSDGIGSADVVLVPLEDGDRCEALVKMGKKVITIDLNPLSRTAQTAHITIVDEFVGIFAPVKIRIASPGFTFMFFLSPAAIRLLQKKIFFNFKSAFKIA